MSSTSKLKLNPDKTEFITFGSQRQRDKLKECFPIDILGNPLLGVWFNSDFSLSKHVQNVCKCHTGFPRYFAPYLSSYSSSYSTRRSQSSGNFLVILKFYPSVYKSVKQFGNSFAFDAPTVWNALPDEIRASPSLASFRKHFKTYL